MLLRNMISQEDLILYQSTKGSNTVCHVLSMLGVDWKSCASKNHTHLLQPLISVYSKIVGKKSNSKVGGP